MLGVDKLSVVAKKYGLGSKVLNDLFVEEKEGIVPSTKWKKQNLEQSWYLGETIITGIGQGYIQTTPLQLCLMTAQLANGGYKIKPNMIYDQNNNFEKIILKIQNNEMEKLYKNSKNIKFVLDAMFSSTNELYGTSFKSRHEDIKLSLIHI